MRRDFNNKLKVFLSPDRLSGYGQDNPGECILLARYLWNVALCESFYSPLQICEIALRNSMHAMLTTFYKQDTWYSLAKLTTWGTNQVTKAQDKLKKIQRPLNSGRVVAELHFGFWISLFEGYYEQNKLFMPAAIKKIFPQLPKSLHNRKKLKERLDSIRCLRNRVFHHERIIHYKDLSEQHAKILITIGWICPELEDLSLKLDRFEETYRRGIDPWIEKIRNHWPR